MSQKMKEAVTDLLKKYNLEGAFTQAKGGAFHLRLEHKSFMPLVIEKTMPNLVSVAHYGEMNGDAMRDPEMLFRIQEDGTWLPYSFQNDYLGLYQEVFTEDGYRPQLLKSLLSFANTWANNIRDQGWLDDGVQATSLSHPSALTHI